MRRTHRVLTIHSFSTYKNIFGEYVPNPCIRLQGKWVSKLGFDPGSKVEVRGKDGLLIVKLVR